ncbi:alpha/beta hydrolase [Marinigracilibium pacificum]|uniref:Phospholipase/carboxylesterase/thioesterase domain-containing protein n=1 Tax=Marinigracilibium pacificum TaxID=2729599 RepID=A0A848IYE3_9BACT|nr:hypothetical protein [Marinigracilibium pacificum]NMM48188.1 hypothetical protein [Marinigracilibium pacificum]
MNKTDSIDFSFKAPYLKIGTSPEVANRIWIIFHGYGQNVNYFSKKFNHFTTDDCLIFPQGLSLFYLGEKYDKVGASWLTKEFREEGRSNQINYIKALIEMLFKGIDLSIKELVILGFSQGVATATRIISELGLSPDKLICYAGNPAHDIFTPIKLKKTSKVFFVYGDSDEYITGKNADKIKNYIQELTKKTPDVIKYQGGHTINSSIIKTIITS